MKRHIRRFAGHCRMPPKALSERFVRPHDISVEGEPVDGGVQALVARVVHLGFEVRVELRVDGDQAVDVQITRDAAERLGLAPGDVVWLRPPLDERVLDVA